ncbi:MAG TPA: DUF4160 domain-containing protein [Candidatus Eisenbacteria bacterium]
MPEVSRFFGIVISMYFDDHWPPHFHARYGESDAVIAIESLGTLRGALPGRARDLVVEWATEHRDELMANWARARDRKPLRKIAPLR